MEKNEEDVKFICLVGIKRGWRENKFTQTRKIASFYLWNDETSSPLLLAKSLF